MVTIDKLRKRPPPPRRRAKAEPVSVTDIKKSKAQIKVDEAKIADAHKRRVTLNLLLHSKCIPDNLRKAIEKLPKLGWDLEALTKKDAEIIFALTDEYADKARDEFVADLETIRDLHRDPRGGNPLDECLLCGHQHIRWEFDLRNIAGGKSTKTGSTCIETYGLNVDGYGTAEAALKALRAAINKAKDEAKKLDWQEAHPDHEAKMDALDDALYWMRKYRKLSDWRLYNHVGPAWSERISVLESAGQGAIKYYRRKGYLTETKTEDVYGGPRVTGILQAVADMQDEIRHGNDAMIDALRGVK